MVVKQGDIFWVDMGNPTGSGPAYRRPQLVVQNNAFNSSRIDTVVVCSLTTNLRLAESPGNVLLAEGEGNLRRRSVVNISQLFTVSKSELREQIGSLSDYRMIQVLEGIQLLLIPRDIKG